MSWIKVKGVMVELNATPFETPADYEIASHQGGGRKRVEYYNNNIHIHHRPVILCKINEGINGLDLERKVANIYTLNATVLEALRRYPDLVPDDWRNCFLYFFGTVFVNKKDKDRSIYHLHVDDKGNPSLIFRSLQNGMAGDVSFVPYLDRGL
jgi:hypothetical protein